MALDKKDRKKLIQLCIKMSSIFNDVYISTHGYIISMDIEKPFIIQVDDSYIELFKSLFGEFKFFRIWNIKEFKKNLEAYLELDGLDTDEEKVKYASKLVIDNKLNCLKDISNSLVVISITDNPDESKVTIGDANKIRNLLYETARSYTSVITSRIETEKIVNLLTEKINEINSISNWENFVLADNPEDNEKLILSLFKKNDYINFSPKHSDGPPIILTKSLLPLVSEKNYTNLYYATKKINSELFLIVFDFDFDLFRLYMMHYYIPID